MFKATRILLSLLCGLGITGTAIPLAQPAPDSDRSRQATVWSILKRKMPPSRGSRGLICEVAPGLLGPTYVVWNQRPLFLWERGGMLVPGTAIKVYESESQAIVWEKSLAATDDSATYDGRPLQAGSVYKWEMIPHPGGEPKSFSFRFMEPQPRQKIAIELQQLTEQLQAAGATPETIALQQAHYFADQDLLSDALQVLYTLKQPSASTAATLQDLVKSACLEAPAPSLQLPSGSTSRDLK